MSAKRRAKNMLERKARHIERRAQREEDPDKAYGLLKSAEYLREEGTPAAVIARAEKEKADWAAKHRQLPGLPPSHQVLINPATGRPYTIKEVQA